MKTINNMSVLSGADVAKIQIELCAIKGCSNKAVKKWKDYQFLRAKICEQHFEIYSKEIGQID